MKTKPSTRLVRLVAMEAADVAGEIQPIIERARPVTRGAVLADLVADYFAINFHPYVREEQIALWMETMQSMIPLNEIDAGDPWKSERQ